MIKLHILWHIIGTASRIKHHFFHQMDDNDVNIVLPMFSKRAIRRGAISKRGGQHLFEEKEEEERGGRTELGGETARELGKLSGKSTNIVCV